MLLSPFIFIARPQSCPSSFLIYACPHQHMNEGRFVLSFFTFFEKFFAFFPSGPSTLVFCFFFAFFCFLWLKTRLFRAKKTLFHRIGYKKRPPNCFSQDVRGRLTRFDFSIYSAPRSNPIARKSSVSHDSFLSPLPTPSILSSSLTST